MKEDRRRWSKFIKRISLILPLIFVNSIFAKETTCYTGECLKTNAENAIDGDIIYIDKGSVIDLTGLGMVTIRASITIDGRGSKYAFGAPGKANEIKSDGGIITTSSDGVMFKILAGNVTFKSLVLQGQGNSNTGIYVLANYFTITKSELYGWNTAITIKGPTQNEISHNYIHHNNKGNGYGVLMSGPGGHAVINNNDFNWNHHAVSGGTKTNDTQPGYTAKFNWLGPDSTGSDFDMHGCADYSDCSGNMSGRYLKIHDNVFTGSVSHVVVRGVPTGYAHVYDNHFAQVNINSAVKQCYIERGTSDNVYEWSNFCKDGRGCHTPISNTIVDGIWDNSGFCSSPPHP